MAVSAVADINSLPAGKYAKRRFLYRLGMENATSPRAGQQCPF
jgi:hypothetical protein